MNMFRDINHIHYTSLRLLFLSIMRLLMVTHWCYSNLNLLYYMHVGSRNQYARRGWGIISFDCWIPAPTQKSKCRDCSFFFIALWAIHVFQHYLAWFAYCWTLLSGFHLGFLSRGGKRDNSRVKGGGGQRLFVCFSIHKEWRFAH